MRSLANFCHSFILPKEAIQKKLYIVPLAEKDVEESLKLITDGFMKNTAISRLLNVNHDKFYEFARVGLQRSMDEELAFVCKDPAQSKIVGTAIFWDQFNKLQQPLQYGKSFNSIADNGMEPVINSLLRDKKMIPTKPYEMIYCSYLAADPSHSKSQISKELMKFFVQSHPLGSKASLIYRECLTPYNEKVLSKLGWKRIHQIQWKKYLPIEQQPFVKLAEEKAKLLGLSLTDAISLMGYRRN